MDTRGIDQMLSELRATSQVAAGKPTQAASAAGGTDFGEVLKSAIDQVSSAQMQAQEMAKEIGRASCRERVSSPV